MMWVLPTTIILTEHSILLGNYSYNAERISSIVSKAAVEIFHKLIRRFVGSDVGIFRPVILYSVSLLVRTKIVHANYEKISLR